MNAQLLTMVLVSLVNASWQANTRVDGLVDNADYHMRMHSADVMHAGEQFVQILQASWTEYDRSNADQGIREFYGSEMGAALALQGLLGLWWGHVEWGFQGEMKPEQMVGKGILARAFLFPSTKWTPRVSLYRKPLGMYPLPLSLSAFQEGIEAGFAWETQGGAGDFSLSVLQWRSISAQNRTENTSLDQLPEPRQVRAAIYWLTRTASRIRYGYAIGVEAADRTTQVPTQWAPSVEYNWMPAAAPRLGAGASLLLEAHLLSLEFVHWYVKASLPVISAQRREWENTSVDDWGTSPLDLQTEFLVPWKALQIKWGGQWRSTPWNHMRYADEDAYMEWRGTIQLGYSF